MFMAIEKPQFIVFRGINGEGYPSSAYQDRYYKIINEGCILFNDMNAPENLRINCQEAKNGENNRH